MRPTDQPTMPRGTRESEWLIIRRCLAIIRRIQRGPIDWPGLIQAVRAEAGPDAYGQAEDSALRKRFYRDLEHIRHSLNINLQCSRRTGEYTLGENDQPLIDLPDEDLAILAWLDQTFTTNSPQHRGVQALIERLRLYLSPERRRQIEQYRTGLVLNLGQRDEDRIAPEVEEGLATALARRRRVQFDYLSPRYEDGRPRRHVVDIFEPYYFNPVRGHYYLRGWCHSITGPAGPVSVNNYLDYRLGRISRLQLLPHKLPPQPPPARRYPVIYRLDPELARSGVTRQPWIDIERIEQPGDGSAVIHGTTESIFWAVQDLMHYRYHCRVLGGPDMLAEMRQTAQKMAELYAE